MDPSAGVTYDSPQAGHVTWDGFHSYTYDAEGRIATVDGNISYIYDAEGQRTAVLSGGTVVRQYLYDNVGRPATVLDGNGNLIRAEIWAGNMHLGDYVPDGANNYTNNYILSDHLGNLRAVYDSAGNQIETRQSLPFGEEQNATGTDVDPLHYTGKERDTESGLDYFPARHYSSNMGRFMSPDPSGLYMADPANPQQLNLYAYVGNNPLRFTDPLGLSSDCGGGGDPSVVCMVTTAWDWLKNNLGGGGSGNQNNPSSPGGGGGQGPDPTDQSPLASPLTFPTRDAAGIAAARQALIPATTPDRTNPRCSAGCNYEWGGRILKNGSGQYTFTQPVTFKNSTQFFTSHVMIPFGYRKAGSYHTHPPGTTGMSSEDANWANAQHLPEYMGQAGTGQVWKYAGDNSCSAEPCGSVIYDPNHP